MSIAENIATIRAQIEEAAIAAGRDPKEILLCAATKISIGFAASPAEKFFPLPDRFCTKTTNEICYHRYIPTERRSTYVRNHQFAGRHFE
jgi:hypothetical protein